MVYLITRHWFPSHKAKEVAKKFIETIPKYPPEDITISILISQATKITKKGVFIITTQEVKPGKLEEAMSRESEAQSNFLDIENYEYSIDVFYNTTEALEIIGMKLPE
jgi:hypothetical protein